MLSTIALTTVSAVPTIPLGDSGVQMPMVIVGTFTLNETEAYDAVSSALSVGFTGAHCDWSYFNLPGCGKALKAAFDGSVKREKFYLQASVAGYGFFSDHLPENVSAAEATKIQIDETLKGLHVDYLDHLFLHMPPQSMMSAGNCTAAEASGERTCEETIEQWRVMEKYFMDGKVKSLGVSNFCPDCFSCLDSAELQVNPVLNQIEMHVGWGKDMLGIWSYNRKRGIVPQAYSPLGGREGAFDPEVLHGNLTNRIAKAHNKTAADVALKWLVANMVPLAVQSMNPAHLASDIDLWSWSFTPEEKRELDNWLSGSTISPSWLCKDWDIPTDVPFFLA